MNPRWWSDPLSEHASAITCPEHPLGGQAGVSILEHASSHVRQPVYESKYGSIAFLKDSSTPRQNTFIILLDSRTKLGQKPILDG